MKKYCFGIDVGGTTIKCGLFLTDGTLLDKWELPTRRENKGAQILPDAAGSVLQKCREKGIALEDVEGVGVGVPGPVNDRGEVPCAVNLYWDYMDVAGDIRKYTGLKAKAANDANVAALGEAWRGAAAGGQNVIMVTLGTGVGGGIILNGRIVTGAHGAGGEIGHAVVEPAETEFCNCGNQGCLEQVASATGIVHLAKKWLDSHSEDTVLREGELTAKAVFDAYKAGDAAGREIVELFADYLGRALAAYACVTDPEVFVIGGGVSKAGQVLIDAVQGCYRKYAFPPCKDTPVVLATLGNDAGIYGAAKLVLD